ncbi:pseudouridylate synthase 7 homolog [Daphnia carinata]|uniref:pseudouridylate synthase 7 homolog n=1 Tax=Daphnia carinata TaxID=120202 RepID=UPI00257B0C8E|nr:pseudouridylate synthase 7 homolog [Daphnia carinata]
MEVDDCESVSEAKGQTLKKKIDVLGAMAKYNLKKQQERELSMKPATKQQNSPKCTPEKRPTNFKQEYVKIERKESDVGISEYVSKGAGFSAILKQRYSDFQVHEIDMNGTVIHLTDQSIVEYVAPPPTVALAEQQNVLTPEQWKNIEDMVKNGDPKQVEIDVTEKSKEERQNIHKIVRTKYEDENVTSNSAPVDGRTVMKIFKMEGRQERRQNDKRRMGCMYTQFVLYKENQSTMEAVNTVARIIKMKPACFMTAGTKDKRAITSQLVTVKSVEPLKLLNSVRSNAKIAVGNFTYTEKPLQLGNLKGNRFVIVLRNVLGDESQILANLESLKEVGFINYYGSQRFGTRHVPTHFIGKQLILGRWQEAINLILEPPEINGKYQRDYDLTLARVEYKSSKDAHKAFGKIKKSLHTIEAQLLLNLKKHGKDLLGALNTIPRNMRLTYIHAYQSFLWNTVVSKRLSTFGPKPIVGDLVYAPGSSNDDVDPEIEMENEDQVEAETDQSNEKDVDGEKSNKKAQRNQRKVIFIDENNIHNYTINDVLLPLPGFDITYPANEVAKWYTELLQADGLSEMDFKQSTKTYNLGGAYRLVMSKPSDVKWKFVRYDNPTLNLIPSDWDRLENTQLPPAVVEDGAYLGLILEFNLPASAYATMALREITKMDMSSEFQTTLNEAGGSKQPAPVAGGETAENEPEVKRIKLEDNKESAAPAATSEMAANQCEVKRIKTEPDSNQHSVAPAASEFSENPGVKQIKQESGVTSP